MRASFIRDFALYIVQRFLPNRFYLFIWQPDVSIHYFPIKHWYHTEGKYHVLNLIEMFISIFKVILNKLRILGASLCLMLITLFIPDNDCNSGFDFCSWRCQASLIVVTVQIYAHEHPPPPPLFWCLQMQQEQELSKTLRRDKKLDKQLSSYLKIVLTA